MPTDRRDVSPSRKRRLSARVAVFLLAREMWMNANAIYDGSAWDDDTLLSSIYEKYIERAEKAVRLEMDRA